MHPAWNCRVGSGIDENLCDFIRTIASNLSQGSITCSALIMSIHIRTGIEQIFHRLDMAFLSSVVQRCHSKLVEVVYLVAFLDESFHLIQVSLLTSHVKTVSKDKFNTPRFNRGIQISLRSRVFLGVLH